MPTTPAHSSTSMESAYSPNSSSSSRQSPSRNTYDSPSRQLHSETRRRRRRHHFDDVDLMDSPSRQLILEFNQMIINTEHIANTRLDLAAASHTKSHLNDLAAAASEHARVLKFAEGELRIELMELERQRIAEEMLLARREAEKRAELQRIEREKREAAEKERQREAALKREEELRKAEEKKKAEEEAETRRKAEEEERKKVAQAEAERKAKAASDAAAAEKARQEAALKAQQAQQALQAQQRTQSAPAAQPTAVAPSALSATLAQRKAATLAEREALHKRYLDLHKKLKGFRQFVVSENKGDKALGELRREMRVKAGQISSDKANNTRALNAVRDVLRRALQAANFKTVDIREFIVQPIPAISQDSEAQYPAVLLYLLNIFAKAIIAQFISEASNDNNPIDPIGLMAVSIFSDDAFKWKGVSMIDLLLAKMHTICPVLYGIYGRENTEQGRGRLGWQREDGDFVDVGTHDTRMLGLGAGFASMTLRIFKSKVPPIPGSEYWRSLSCIINTPPEELTATHFIVLRGMLKGFVEKFIAQFGQPALAALKLAIIDLPDRISNKTPNEQSVRRAAAKVSVLKDTLKRDLYLTLA